MKLGQLNQTVILIDTEYLNSRIVDTLEFYRDLYPNKIFKKINIGNLLYNFVLNARVEEAGHTVDVLFAYRMTKSTFTFCEPSNVFDFIDVHNVSLETEKGTLRIRSFFADADESCIHHFINMLDMIYRNKNVSRIIMVADDNELNPVLEVMYEQADKSLFMLKDYQETQIEVPITYVKIDYPIAHSLGLRTSEL